MEAMLAEKHGIKKGLLADINATTETARIGLMRSYRVAAVIHAVAAAEDLTVDLVQHDAETAGNSKALVKDCRVYFKTDAEDTYTLREFEAVSQIVIPELNGSAGTVIVEVLGEELDTNANFNHVSLAFTAGVARLACVDFVAHEMDVKPAYKVAL